MSHLPWIKLFTKIYADHKLFQLSDAQKWRFVQLLAFAGECDAEGYLVAANQPLAVEYIARRLLVEPRVLARDLEALSRLGLVALDTESGAWLIPSFAAHQERPADQQRAYWREQKRRQRASLRSALSPASTAEPGSPTSPQLSDPDRGSPEQSPQPPLSTGEDLPPFPPGFRDPLLEMEADSAADIPPLKRRELEKRGRGGEARGESSRGESKKPPTPSRRGLSKPPGLSGLDELANELAGEAEWLSPPE